MRIDPATIKADEEAFARTLVDQRNCACDHCGHRHRHNPIQPMTGVQVATEIMKAPALVVRHPLVLDFTPVGGRVRLPPRSIWSWVYGVSWTEDVCVVLTLGPVHFENLPAPNGTKETT